jgi:sec-independent protein translocase protein TatB
MFNIAFPELIVIVVVALIVIGPDKLPKVAHTLGVMMGRMQRFMSAVKNDIDQELKNNDLLRLQEELKLQHEGLNEELRKGMQPVADVIRRPEQTTTDPEPAEPAPTQTVDKEAEQQTRTAKPEGIST